MTSAMTINHSDITDFFIYFGNIFPNEPQYKSGLFYGLALTSKFDRDIAHDARLPMPFADDSIKGFQSQDVFEHIPYADVSRILDDIFRFLRPKGLFRLSIPDYNSPLLRKRSVYDYDGNILCDLAMGGKVSAHSLSGSVKVDLADGGDAHLWFPTYTNVMQLIVSSNIRKCNTIKVQHAWIDANNCICEPFDHGVMPVIRTPPRDMRANGKPISIVIDFIK
jgi:SAM-dependent methyltransferase